MEFWIGGKSLSVGALGGMEISVGRVEKPHRIGGPSPLISAEAHTCEFPASWEPDIQTLRQKILVKSGHPKTIIVDSARDIDPGGHTNKFCCAKEMSDESKPNRTKKRLAAGIGLIVGLVALAAAFLSPQIAEAIDPPTPPVEEVAVDLASRIIDAAKAKATGQEYQPEAAPQQLPSRFIYPVVIGLGMIAAAFGVAAFIRS